MAKKTAMVQPPPVGAVLRDRPLRDRPSVGAVLRDRPLRDRPPVGAVLHDRPLRDRPLRDRPLRDRPSLEDILKKLGNNRAYTVISRGDSKGSPYWVVHFEGDAAPKIITADTK